MLSFGNAMLWRHRARDFDAVIEYYIKRPNDRSGVNLEEKSFGFYLQQSDERCIFALHKICNIIYVTQIMEQLKNPYVIYGYKGAEYFCDRKKETETDRSDAEQSEHDAQ